MSAHNGGNHGPVGPGDPEGEQQRCRLVVLLAAAEPDTGGCGSAGGRGWARLGRVCAFSVSVLPRV